MPSKKYPELNDSDWVLEQEKEHGGIRPAARANGIPIDAWFRHSPTTRDKKLAAEKRHDQSEKARERRRRYNQSEKGRERNRRHDQSEKARERRRLYNQLRRSDWRYRLWMTLYTMDYRHRRKRERWANAGLTLRDYDQEGHQGRDCSSS